MKIHEDWFHHRHQSDGIWWKISLVMSSDWIKKSCIIQSYSTRQIRHIDIACNEVPMAERAKKQPKRDCALYYTRYYLCCMEKRWSQRTFQILQKIQNRSEQYFWIMCFSCNLIETKARERKHILLLGLLRPEPEPSWPNGSKRYLPSSTSGEAASTGANVGARSYQTLANACASWIK